MSNGKKFFSGNSLEQAVLQGARYFGLEAEELAYRKIERRHGFLKVRRRVVIEVDAEAPRREPGSLEDEPRPTAAPQQGGQERAAREARQSRESPRKRERQKRREDEDEPDLMMLPDAPSSPSQRLAKATGERAEAAHEAIRRLLALGGLEVEAEVFEGDEELQIEIRGEDEDVFLDDRGRLLMAMQHLLPRMIRGLTGDAVACRVDCDNFQEIRTEQLRVLAQRVAAEVRDGRRSRTLEPMSPDERRIVHMTLADDPKVETESQGTGLFKRVTVRPVGRRSRSSRS
jgi:spoIIIJ-associated protein